MWLCPYCNGLKNLEIFCPRCQDFLHDLGKLSDYFAPYSPYREIDDLKLSNGFPHDATSHYCLHVVHCPTCQYENQALFKEDEFYWINNNFQ